MPVPDLSRYDALVRLICKREDCSARVLVPLHSLGQTSFTCPACGQFHAQTDYANLAAAISNLAAAIEMANCGSRSVKNALNAVLCDMPAIHPK